MFRTVLFIQCLETMTRAIYKWLNGKKCTFQRPNKENETGSRMIRIVSEHLQSKPVVGSRGKAQQKDLPEGMFLCYFLVVALKKS